MQAHYQRAHAVLSMRVLAKCPCFPNDFLDLRLRLPVQLKERLQESSIKTAGAVVYLLEPSCLLGVQPKSVPMG